MCKLQTKARELLTWASFKKVLTIIKSRIKESAPFCYKKTVENAIRGNNNFKIFKKCWYTLNLH